MEHKTAGIGRKAEVTNQAHEVSGAGSQNAKEVRLHPLDTFPYICVLLNYTPNVLDMHYRPPYFFR